MAGLYAKGLDAILKKLGEEATETLLAAKGGDRRALVYETADLWFHSLVALAALESRTRGGPGGAGATLRPVGDRGEGPSGPMTGTYENSSQPCYRLVKARDP